ncbi:MAG: DUF1036 domain-containing protein [Pseudomonadota bacterium]
MRIFVMIAVFLTGFSIALPAVAQSNDAKNPDVALDNGWRLCNKSDHEDVYVAYSYFENDRWVTKGWRRINKDRCEVFQSKFTNKTAYFYAISGNEKAEWDGDVNLCAHEDEKFEYFGDDFDCTGDYRLFPFYALDLTGATRGVTRNLTSN